LSETSLFSLGFEPWIFLEFLGISRPNLDFSMGYGASAVDIFYSLLSPRYSQQRSVGHLRPRALPATGRSRSIIVMDRQPNRSSGFQQAFATNRLSSSNDCELGRAAPLAATRTSNATNRHFLFRPASNGRSGGSRRALYVFEQPRGQAVDADHVLLAGFDRVIALGASPIKRRELAVIVEGRRPIAAGRLR
jgi:hypothetical protein